MSLSLLDQYTKEIDDINSRIHSITVTPPPCEIPTYLIFVYIAVFIFVIYFLLKLEWKTKN